MNISSLNYWFRDATFSQEQVSGKQKLQKPHDKLCCCCNIPVKSPHKPLSMIRFCFYDLNKWIIIFTFVTWLFMTSSKLKEQPWLHHTLLHKLRFPPWDCWHTFAGIGLRDGSSATKDFQEVFTAAVRPSQGENHSAYFFMDTSWCFFLTTLISCIALLSQCLLDRSDMLYVVELVLECNSCLHVLHCLERLFVECRPAVTLWRQSADMSLDLRFAFFKKYIYSNIWIKVMVTVSFVRPLV